jgi:hypothetical protein
MRLLRVAAIAAIEFASGFALLLPAAAQIGTVAMRDATVSGKLSVTNDRAILLGSSTVIARDHTAAIMLNRGGTVNVCATSGLHLTESQVTGNQPLMLALDRGAIEVKTRVLASDVILTPDLRLTVHAPGPLDLRLRVTNNGDTCVENRGADAPSLAITDQFGESTYQVLAGQHVLFEHGSLKEVVDNESSPCGCPAVAASGSSDGMSIADALLASKSKATPAAQQHPFPAAVSQGLEPSPPIPQAPPGVAHAQVSATLGYSGNGSGTIAGEPANPAAATTAAVPESTAGQPQSAQPEPVHKPGVVRRIGRFFKRLFGG